MVAVYGVRVTLHPRTTRVRGLVKPIKIPDYPTPPHIVAQLQRQAEKITYARVANGKLVTALQECDTEIARLTREHGLWRGAAVGLGVVAIIAVFVAVFA